MRGLPRHGETALALWQRFATTRDAHEPGPAAPEAKDGRGTNLLDARPSRRAASRASRSRTTASCCSDRSPTRHVVDRAAGVRLEPARHAAYSEEGALRAYGAEGWQDHGVTACRRTSRRRRANDVPRVTRRGSRAASLSPGADPNQKRDMLHKRGEQDAQLDAVQLPGAARRHLHAGQGRQRGRRQDIAVRSSSAVVVSSQDLNAVVFTTSTDGVVRRLCRTGVQYPRPAHGAPTETKKCTDCHPSAAGDNNAVMAQLLTAGHQLTNFMGRRLRRHR